jgi:hypothetical protein
VDLFDANRNKEPALSVQKASIGNKGKIGFWGYADNRTVLAVYIRIMLIYEDAGAPLWSF